MKVHASKDELQSLPEWVADFVDAAWSTPDVLAARGAAARGMREIAGRFADSLREAIQDSAVCGAKNISVVLTKLPKFVEAMFIVDKQVKIAAASCRRGRRAALASCLVCGSLMQPGKGRGGRTCSDACRLKLHRWEEDNGEEFGGKQWLAYSRTPWGGGRLSGTSAATAHKVGGCGIVGPRHPAGGDGYEHAIELAATGTGKDDLEARALAWIRSRQKLGKLTEKSAAGYIEKIKGWSRLLGPTPYKRLASADVDRASRGWRLARRPRSGAERRSAHHYRTVLACSTPSEENEIARNPMRGVEGVGGLERTRRAPTAVELQRMLAAAKASPVFDGQLATIIRIASHLGLRRGELCALRWSDLDFERMTVTVARAGRPALWEGLLQTAGAKAGLRVAMLEPTAVVLREQRKRVAARRLAAGQGVGGKRPWSSTDALGQVLDLNHLSHAAGIIRDRVGVPRAVLPLHGQRHYALTALHKHGVDLLPIQSRAGHGDIRSTQTYITIDIDKDREAAVKAAASLL